METLSVLSKMQCLHPNNMIARSLSKKATTRAYKLIYYGLSVVTIKKQLSYLLPLTKLQLPVQGFVVLSLNDSTTTSYAPGWSM